MIRSESMRRLEPVPVNSDNHKRALRSAIAWDVEAFLQAGNEIEELPPAARGWGSRQYPMGFDLNLSSTPRPSRHRR